MTAAVGRVLAALGRAGCSPRQRGERQWTARCPVHDDSTPSLSVGIGRDGRALLRCWAGCATVDVVAALGLAMRDLFPPRAPQSRSLRRRMRP